MKLYTNEGNYALARPHIIWLKEEFSSCNTSTFWDSNYPTKYAQSYPHSRSQIISDGSHVIAYYLIQRLIRRSPSQKNFSYNEEVFTAFFWKRQPL